MRRRGFSLTEVMVAGALLALVFGLLVQTLGPGFRAWMRGDRKSDAQQNALVVVSRIGEEIRHAHPDTIFVKQQTVHDAKDNVDVRRDFISFVTAVGDDGKILLGPEGDPIWQRRVFYYHEGDNRQVRMQSIPLPSPAPVAPPEPSPTPLLDPSPLILDSYTADSRDRVVARNVRALEMSYETPNLSLQVDTMVDTYACHLQSTVTPIYVSFSVPVPSPSPP